MSTLDLMIVMPVFNEQQSIRGVVEEWEAVAGKIGNCRLLVIDDGSTDQTPEILAGLPPAWAVEVVRQDNRGHGQSCLRGYRIAAEREVPFVFQIDSDGQCDPIFFASLWRKRLDFDVIYGVRVRREDGLRRIAASLLLRLELALVAGVDARDANTPYRLMRTEGLLAKIDRIPSDFHLANVALAVLLRKDPGVREGRVPITFRARTGGEPKVPLRRFAREACRLIFSLRKLLRATRDSATAVTPERSDV